MTLFEFTTSLKFRLKLNTALFFPTYELSIDSMKTIYFMLQLLSESFSKMCILIVKNQERVML